MLNLRVCVLTTNQKGTNSQIARNFISSNYLIILDIAEGKIKRVKSLENKLSEEALMAKELANLMDRQKIDVVVVGEAGDRCMELLHSSKVKEVIETTGKVADVVKEYFSEGLNFLQFKTRAIRK